VMGEPIHLVRDDEAVSVAATAFEAFVAEHQDRLFGALCLITGDRSEAEDIAQEAFLRVLERWDRVEAMEEPGGYLFRVSMNLFRSRRRRAAVALRRMVLPSAPATDAFEAVDDRTVVLRALSDLVPEQRAALVVTGLYGLSSDEAADVLGVQPSTVRARASRARAALREAIGDVR
jgi:RNA polymerase sigma-70 factor, ECF subfamily